MATSRDFPETPFPFHSVSNGEWNRPPNDCDKERILGLNAADLYGVDVEAARGEIAADQLSKFRAEKGSADSSRSHYVYGPESPEEFRLLMAHAGEIDLAP